MGSGKPLPIFFVGKARTLKKLKVILIPGLPGSGKTTLAKTYIEKGYHQLSRDELQKDRGGKIVRTAELLPILEDKLKNGVSVVADNTLLTREKRKPFIDLAKKYKAKVHAYYIDISAYQCEINVLCRMMENHGRIYFHPSEMKDVNDPGCVPIATLFKMSREYERPTTSEGFDEVWFTEFKRKWPTEFQKQALIFDYDGTLRHSVGPHPYPIKPEDVRILPNRIETLNRYKSWLKLGVSNQSCIAKGIASEDIVKKCFDKTNAFLGNVIKEYTYCPHASAPVSCYCRKPQSGNGVYLIYKYKLRPEKCIFVGDFTSDKTFAERLGFKYVSEEEFFK